MAKLPDGVVVFIKAKKTEFEYEYHDLIKCKNCENYMPEIKMCTAWGSWAQDDGFCFKAEKKKEETEDEM